MDAVFDITVFHAGAIGGHVCTQCIAIAGANAVTLKEKVIKKLLLQAVSMQHWIASFDS